MISLSIILTCPPKEPYPLGDSCRIGIRISTRIGYRQPILDPILAPILVGMTLLRDHRWAIHIAGRLNCGRSILSLFDYMMATESPGDGCRSAISRLMTEGPSEYGPLLG